MPQSWPSQWTILFLLFILSFLLVMILTYFLAAKQVNKKVLFSSTTPNFIWQW